MPGRPADLAAGALGAALGAGTVAVSGRGAAVIAAAAVLGGSLALVRGHQPAAWIVAAVAIAGIVLADPRSEVPFLTYMLVVAQALGAGRWAPAFRSGVAGVVTLTAASLLAAAFSHGAAVPIFFIPIAAWAAGWAVREREIVAVRLAERARELEAEREAHAELSVRYERSRIAAELHDIVAHAISVMVVQAGAGQRLAAVDAELTTEAFASIADAARQAERDMGRLVALLSDQDAVGAAPDLTLVQELIARAAGTGLDVTLRLEGDREGFPPAVAQAAYRVVQESLTNAMRYAAGAAVDVGVRGDRDGLAVEVVNAQATDAAELAGQGGGRGLAGLRDRVAACGGHLRSGPTDAGGWRVSVFVPRSAGALPPAPHASGASTS